MTTLGVVILITSFSYSSKQALRAIAFTVNLPFSCFVL
uniref:Uncharacterized protein MANES_01G071700 n=1 Tax=Rhizophora mucronata TaxID=61149 RepID=A0A2P2P583_RHIMU